MRVFCDPVSVCCTYRAHFSAQWYGEREAMNVWPSIVGHARPRFRGHGLPHSVVGLHGQLLSSLCTSLLIS